MKMEDDARPHGQEEILIEPQRIPDKINYSILSGETCFQIFRLAEIITKNWLFNLPNMHIK